MIQVCWRHASNVAYTVAYRLVNKLPMFKPELRIELVFVANHPASHALERQAD